MTAYFYSINHTRKLAEKGSMRAKKNVDTYDHARTDALNHKNIIQQAILINEDELYRQWVEGERLWRKDKHPVSKGFLIRES